MTYQSLIDQMPLGLEKVILRILDGCRGKDNAIRRIELLKVIHDTSLPGMVTVDDRKVRESIELLRRKGLRICNVFAGDGYFIAETEQEYQEFKVKYTAYARSIFITTKAMDECKEIKVEDGEIIELEPMQLNLI